jgi:uncharacterized protein with von Willebrand factor type A (vWA) domain
MSPIAPADLKKQEKPKAGALRVAEALAPQTQRNPEPPKAETEFSARLTVSEREVLKGKDFAQMSADEIAKAKRLIAEMRLPDDAVVTRRFTADAHGRRIDPRRTFRRSLRGGGAVIDLAYRSPATRHPPLVALVDISGSMAEYSRLFLHFLHAVAEKRRRVHSFVFATRLTNISRELTSRDPDDALARAAARVQDWEGGTRISHALHEFNRLWSRRVLGQGAVVLLFTDGLEREVTTELTFEMDRLKRSCRRLVWLNPLLRFDAFEPARAASAPCSRTCTISARSTASAPWTSSAGPSRPRGRGGQPAALVAKGGIALNCVSFRGGEAEPGTQMARSLRTGLAIWVSARPAGDRNDSEEPMLSTDTDILREAESWRRAGKGVALATVVETWGSAPRPSGAISSSTRRATFSVPFRAAASKARSSPRPWT